MQMVLILVLINNCGRDIRDICDFKTSHTQTQNDTHTQSHTERQAHTQTDSKTYIGTMELRKVLYKFYSVY